jgi:hypothetical protein
MESCVFMISVVVEIILGRHLDVLRVLMVKDSKIEY